MSTEAEGTYLIIDWQLGLSVRDILLLLNFEFKICEMVVLFFGNRCDNIITFRPAATLRLTYKRRTFCKNISKYLLFKRADDELAF